MLVPGPKPVLFLRRFREIPKRLPIGLVQGNLVIQINGSPAEAAMERMQDDRTHVVQVVDAHPAEVLREA
jgi:hypothetical protein